MTTTGAPPMLDLEGPTISVRDLALNVWRSRELLGTLARREFFARYRRATIGVVWAVVLPLLQAVVLAIIFSRVARLTLPVNAFAFVYSGMAAWAFFSVALAAGATAIVDNTALASKIYFPRVVLPLVAVASNTYLAVFNIIVLLIATYASGVSPSPRVLLLVPGLLLVLAVTATMSMLLSALHVYFRDVRYLVQAALLLAFYLTPVFYPLDKAPAALRRVVEINPLTGVVEVYRAATVGADSHWGVSLIFTFVWLVLLTWGALWAHTRYDRVFADLL